MNMLLSSSMESILLAGYVLFGIFLNVIAYLIAVFYHKKFDQPSPKAGFIIAIAMGTFFIITLYTANRDLFFLQIASFVTLLGSGVASAVSVSSLFLTMRKRRK
jgi:hypothetical protein